MEKQNTTKLHILYTEEEGGDFHYIAKHSDVETRQFFKEVIKTGYLIHSVGDKTIKVAPAYLVLAEIVDDYDFVLGQARMEAPKHAGPTKETGEKLTDSVKKTDKENKNVK